MFYFQTKIEYKCKNVKLLIIKNKYTMFNVIFFLHLIDEWRESC